MDGLQLEAVLKRITPLLQDCFDDDDLVASAQLTAAAVPGWDSLANIRLMLMIERAFAIKFSAAEISSFKNVGDLVAVIAAKTTAVA